MVEHLPFTDYRDGGGGISVTNLDRIQIYDMVIKKKLLEKSVNGNVIEVGAGPLCGFILSLKNTLSKTIIEPLAEKYAELRKHLNIEVPNSDEINYFSIGADIFVPELYNTADLILCQNCLDHTTEWAFSLGNLTTYAKKGCIMYFACDLDFHVPTSNMTGHYNSTYNPKKMIQFLMNLGWNIIYDNEFYMGREGRTAVYLVCEKER